MTMKSRSLPFAAILILAMFMLLLPASRAQMPSGKDHLKLQPLERVTGNAGDTVPVTLKFKIDRHWHTYGLIRAVGPDGLGPDPTEISAGPKSIARLAAAGAGHRVRRQAGQGRHGQRTAAALHPRGHGRRRHFRNPD